MTCPATLYRICPEIRIGDAMPVKNFLSPALILMMLLAAGCARVPERALSNPETALDTGGKTTMLFHSVLYYPGAISLNFPGYIVGIEKSPVEKVAEREDILVRGKPRDGLSRKDAYKQVVGKKILYVSHIIQDLNFPYGMGDCALYNAYVQPGDNETNQLVAPCRGYGVTGPVTPKRAYKNSWKALDILRASLEGQLKSGRYTHVVVMTMGWNTVQEEAVRNFNTIVKNIRLAADERGEEFAPLFIGVTWPSQWQSDWLGPLYKMVSFPVKAYDADELGLMWLGVLIHDTLPRAMEDSRRLPLVIIGHSFGARASSVAACVGPVIYEDAGGHIEREGLGDDSILINLQGAFFIKRLLGQEHDRGLYFHDMCSSVSRVFLTSSRYDLAMDAMFFGPYAGNNKSYEKFCLGDKTAGLSCLHADSSGRIIEKSGLDHIVYINADRLIYQNAYLSGGGAHSDIYRKEHGVLIWDMISWKQGYP